MKQKPEKKDVVVLGAGLTGLSAAYHVGSDARVYESAHRVGGECVTDRVGNYFFDRSGHLLHLRTEYVKKLVQRLLPGVFHLVTRDARIRLLGHEMRYPFQANTYGLPPEVKADCLRGYLEAAAQPKAMPRNFAEWARASFGAPIARLFFEPYNRKLWTRPPEQLTLEWMGPYVPKPELARVLAGAFSDLPAGGGYNAYFRYPKQGGIECLAQALARRAPRLLLNARALSVDVRRRTVDIAGQGRQPWSRLISTLPLPVLVAILADPPHRVLEAVRQLQSNSVVVVNLGIRRAKVHPAHWLYFPEPEFCFYRVGFPSNIGAMGLEACSSLYAEISVPAGTPAPKNIVQRVRQDLIRADILRAQDRIEVEHIQYLPYAYVIFDQNYSGARKVIMQYLEGCGIQSVGRWGGWEYSAMEDAILAGKRAAENAAS